MRPLGIQSDPNEVVSPRQIAAEWLQREDEGPLGAEEHARLELWLDADPGHREAYEQVRFVYGLSDEHAADPSIIVLRQAALLAGARRARPIWGALAAAGVAAVIGLGWSGVASLRGPPSASPSPLERVAEALSATADPRSAIYRTRVGERLTFNLPDGSVTTLNTNSILRVAYHDDERGVQLVRGQALFEVAKNKRVPFRVYAGDRRITAVGTVFDVRLDGPRVKVALVEGVVHVSPIKPKSSPEAPVQQVEMTAGEVLEADKAAPMLVTAADTQKAISWRSGIVEFSGEPLRDAVTEINRYTTQPIELDDPSVGAYRVSGVFRTGEPELFAQMMTQVFPLQVAQGAGGAVILKRRDE